MFNMFRLNPLVSVRVKIVVAQVMRPIVVYRDAA